MNNMADNVKLEIVWLITHNSQLNTPNEELDCVFIQTFFVKNHIGGLDFGIHDTVVQITKKTYSN